ncbi:MAG: hypothetical protein WKF73_15595 [Nocardioidaceae bacterium]
MAQDDDLLGYPPHHRQVVADEQERHALLAANVGEQNEDLCLDGDIQCRNRLVEYQQPRFRGQCAAMATR